MSAISRRSSPIVGDRSDTEFVGERRGKRHTRCELARPPYNRASIDYAMDDRHLRAAGTTFDGGPPGPE